MALLGTGSTLKTLAEAASGSATDLDFGDLILRLADMADERERAALLPEDKERVRWLTASELIADPQCHEALIRLLTKRNVAPVLRPNNLPSQLEAFKDQAAAGYRLRIEEKAEKAGKPGEKGQKRTFKHSPQQQDMWFDKDRNKM